MTNIRTNPIPLDPLATKLQALTNKAGNLSKEDMVFLRTLKNNFAMGAATDSSHVELKKLCENLTSILKKKDQIQSEKSILFGNNPLYLGVKAVCNVIHHTAVGPSAIANAKEVKEAKDIVEELSKSSQADFAPPAFKKLAHNLIVAELAKKPENKVLQKALLTLNKIQADKPGATTKIFYALKNTGIATPNAIAGKIAETLPLGQTNSILARLENWRIKGANSKKFPINELPDKDILTPKTPTSNAQISFKVKSLLADNQPEEALKFLETLKERDSTTNAPKDFSDQINQAVTLLSQGKLHEISPENANKILSSKEKDPITTLIQSQLKSSLPFSERLLNDLPTTPTQLFTLLKQNPETLQALPQTEILTAVQAEIKKAPDHISPLCTTYLNTLNLHLIGKVENMLSKATSSNPATPLSKDQIKEITDDTTMLLEHNALSPNSLNTIIERLESAPSSIKNEKPYESFRKTLSSLVLQDINAEISKLDTAIGSLTNSSMKLVEVFGDKYILTKNASGTPFLYKHTVENECSLLLHNLSALHAANKTPANIGSLATIKSIENGETPKTIDPNKLTVDDITKIPVKRVQRNDHDVFLDLCVSNAPDTTNTVEKMFIYQLGSAFYQIAQKDETKTPSLPYCESREDGGGIYAGDILSTAKTELESKKVFTEDQNTMILKMLDPDLDKRPSLAEITNQFPIPTQEANKAKAKAASYLQTLLKQEPSVLKDLAPKDIMPLIDKVKTELIKSPNEDLLKSYAETHTLDLLEKTEEILKTTTPPQTLTSEQTDEVVTNMTTLLNLHNDVYSGLHSDRISAIIKNPLFSSPPKDASIKTQTDQYTANLPGTLAKKIENNSNPNEALQDLATLEKLAPPPEADKINDLRKNIATKLLAKIQETSKELDSSRNSKKEKELIKDLDTLDDLVGKITEKGGSTYLATLNTDITTIKTARASAILTRINTTLKTASFKSIDRALKDLATFDKLAPTTLEEPLQETSNKLIDSLTKAINENPTKLQTDPTSKDAPKLEEALKYANHLLDLAGKTELNYDDQESAINTITTTLATSLEKKIDATLGKLSTKLSRASLDEALTNFNSLKNLANKALEPTKTTLNKTIKTKSEQIAPLLVKTLQKNPATSSDSLNEALKDLETFATLETTSPQKDMTPITQKISSSLILRIQGNLADGNTTPSYLKTALENTRALLKSELLKTNLSKHKEALEEIIKTLKSSSILTDTDPDKNLFNTYTT